MTLFMPCGGTLKLNQLSQPPRHALHQGLNGSFIHPRGPHPLDLRFPRLLVFSVGVLQLVLHPVPCVLNRIEVR
jgi:hypothetical protein